MRKSRGLIAPVIILRIIKITVAQYAAMRYNNKCKGNTNNQQKGAKQK